MDRPGGNLKRTPRPLRDHRRANWTDRQTSLAELKRARLQGDETDIRAGRTECEGAIVAEAAGDRHAQALDGPIGKRAIELDDCADCGRTITRGGEPDRRERKPRASDLIRRELSHSAHRRAGVRLAEKDPPGRKPAALHLDKAVDPDPAAPPIIIKAIAIRQPGPSTGRAVDFRGQDSRCAAAGEIDHPNLRRRRNWPRFG